MLKTFLYIFTFYLYFFSFFLGEGLGAYQRSLKFICGISTFSIYIWININRVFSKQLSVQFSSVQFSRSVVSDSLRPHESQHARSPCPSPTPRVHSDSHPLSQWCHPAISSSVILFSSCLQSFSSSESFLMSQLFTLGGQSIEASTSASVHPMNIQGWFPLGLTGLISLESMGLLSLLQHHSSRV